MISREVDTHIATSYSENILSDAATTESMKQEFIFAVCTTVDLFSLQIIDTY